MSNPRSEYTPEKVAELVAEARTLARYSSISQKEHATAISDLADALTAVSAERDAAEDGLFRVVKALGFDTDGATDAQGFFGPQTYHAKGATYTTAPDIAVAYASEHRAEMEAEADRIEADRDRLHKAITEALAELGDPDGKGPWLSGNIPNAVRRILRAALDKEGEN